MEKLAAVPDPRVMKTHAPWDLLPGRPTGLEPSPCKAHPHADKDREAEPDWLHKPELAFFAKYIQSLGGKLPEKKSVPAVPPEEKPQPENEPVGPPASQSSGEGETEPKPAEAN